MQLPVQTEGKIKFVNFLLQTSDHVLAAPIYLSLLAYNDFNIGKAIKGEPRAVSEESKYKIGICTQMHLEGTRHMCTQEVEDLCVHTHIGEGRRKGIHTHEEGEGVHMCTWGCMHALDPPCSYFNKRKHYILNHRRQCFQIFTLILSAQHQFVLCRLR